MRRIYKPQYKSRISLINGYIHRMENDKRSSLLIPPEIYGIVISFYPRFIDPYDRDEGNVIDAGFATIVRERIMNYMKILCQQSILKML